MGLSLFESARYVDQLLLTDPELIAAVDTSMGKLGYRRVELADLGPEIAECIASRDRSLIRPDFRPQNDRLVYAGDGNAVQVRRYGSKETSYWIDRWGASIIHATSILDTEGFKGEEIDELTLSNDALRRAIEMKRAEIPGIDFKAVTYPISQHPLDPCDEPTYLSGGMLFTNQQLWVNRQHGTDLEGVEREKVITVLSTMLPYLTDVLTRYTRARATAVRAVRSALKEFEEVVGFGAPAL